MGNTSGLTLPVSWGSSRGSEGGLFRFPPILKPSSMPSQTCRDTSQTGWGPREEGTSWSPLRQHSQGCAQQGWGWGRAVFLPSCAVARPEACCPWRILPICSPSLQERHPDIPAQGEGGCHCVSLVQKSCVCPGSCLLIWTLLATLAKGAPIQSLCFHSHLSIIQNLNSLCITKDGN